MSSISYEIALHWKPQQCCGKCKILVRPTDHPWLMVGWSISVLGGLSINNLLRPWNQLKKVKISQSMPMFYLTISTNGHMISVESYVQIHSEIFPAKPQEFIGRQMDHWWWDLGSPGGFMGRIWQPGDHISAALPQDPMYDKSRLVEVMVWRHQAPSHYLIHCWPDDITRG